MTRADRPAVPGPEPAEPVELAEPVRPAEPAEPAVTGSDLTRTYRTADSTTTALRGVSLELPRGSLTVLVGPSGSGKSTLLRLLACLDRPDSGQVMVDGVEVTRLSRGHRDRLRRTRIGVVGQHPADNLLDYLTVAEHLGLGAALRGRPAAGPPDLLDRLGLADRADHRPGQLSGGEQQRAALAFAAVGAPALLAVDEPTGQLDQTSAREVVAALAALATGGVTVVAASHDPAVIDQAGYVVRIRDGERE